SATSGALLGRIRGVPRRGYTGLPSQQLPQLGRTRGLCKVRVESRAVRLLLVPLLAEAGYRYQRHVVAARLPNPSAGFIAVQPRHADVEQDDVRSISLQLEQAALPIVGPSAISAELLAGVVEE